MSHKVLNSAKLSQSSCSNYTPSCTVFVFTLFHTLVYICYFKIFLKFYIFIYLAVLGLSCSKQNLPCVTWGELSLRHLDSLGVA